MFKDLELDLEIRQAADFCREWFQHRKWLKANNIALSQFEEEKKYQQFLDKRKLYQLAKY